MKKPEDILTEAAELVGGERARQHGDYVKQHKRVADLWSTYLNCSVTASDVAFCMVLLKVARDEVGSPNPDDGVDASAYTALWASLTNA